jgi:hypothetical protein
MRDREKFHLNITAINKKRGFLGLLLFCIEPNKTTEHKNNNKENK